MTYEEAVAYINSVQWQKSRPGLSRIRLLLEKLGNPQKKLKFIHVAGTNGKGSVCAMLTQVLCGAGYKTGTFTSPYIKCFNDRMCINGVPISNGELADIVEELRRAAELLEDHPTEFEMVTAAGFLYFFKNRCDIVVLEVGLGGRLDCTNVIDTPEAAVITGIALDHTAILGDTIEKIAAEKAGIIKPGCAVVFGGREAAALPVIEAAAREKAAALTVADYGRIAHVRCTEEKTVFDYKELNNLETGLLGLYQPENAAVAAEVCQVLAEKGWRTGEAALRSGLKRAVWPARFEKLSSDPVVIYDGGHNPEGVNWCVESVKSIFANQRMLVVTGVMADKDYSYMARKLGEIAQEVYAVTPAYYRALPGEKYAAVFAEAGIPAKGFSSVEEGFAQAVEKARREKLPVLVAGSLYMYEEIDRIRDRYLPLGQ